MKVLLLWLYSHLPKILLKFLTSRELSLGLELKIKQIEPFDGSMVISYANKENEMLSSKVCDKLLVSKKSKKK